MSTTHPTTPTGLAVVDEGPDFIRLALPAWLTSEQRQEVKRAADAHFTALVAAARQGVER